MKKNFFLIGILLITNIITLVLLYNDFNTKESEKVSYMYKKALSQYIVFLESKDPSKVQMAISTIIYPDIVSYGENKSIDSEVSYLCKAWNMGLDNVLQKIYTQSVDAEMTDRAKIIGIENEINKKYLLGTKRLNILCL